MTKVDLADFIEEEVERQEKEPKPEPIGKDVETPDPPTSKPRATRKRARLKKQEPEPETEAEAKPIPRQSTWIMEEHFDRLEALKLRQKKRLKQEGKRASVTSLIDEAIEQYLKKME